jgi:hypothetical protein
MIKYKVKKKEVTITDKLNIARTAIVEHFGMHKARSIIPAVQEIADLEIRLDTYYRILQCALNEEQGFKKLINPIEYKLIPVSPETFILDPYYLGLKDQVYPVVLKSFCELNSGDYTESVLTGSIGCAKTTLAIWTTAYQLYLLSCLRNPQQVFSLDKSSEIVFIFQSLNEKLAKAVDFSRFQSLIEQSPHFQEHFMYDKSILSELRFPNRIIVKPVSGADTAAIGQNVMGGIIDELNFMSIVENSKSSRDGGVYDQAIALYNSISRRRKSRFMTQGKLPGVLCLVSSKRYPGQFTDTKMAEAKAELASTGKTSIYVYDKTTWDIMPADRFSGEWFNLFIGDESRKPRILDVGDAVSISMRDKVIRVPIEYRTEFETDIMNALRDIAGVSTLATHPYMMDADAVSACFRKDQESILSRTEVDFIQTKLAIYPELIQHKEAMRWIHIDLGVTGDSAGFVMGHVFGFELMDRGDVKEFLPKIHIDCSLAVQPPKGGEIQFHKIRALIYKLTELGVPIKWVSFDSFQSVDSIQILKTKGYMCGKISMDITTQPYDITKSALYDGRVYGHPHQKLQTELLSLERDTKTGKIDHPSTATGSKDISDALAGVVSGLTGRSEIWYAHGISPAQIPAYLKQSKEKMQGATEAEKSHDHVK